MLTYADRLCRHGFSYDSDLTAALGSRDLQPLTPLITLDTDAIEYASIVSALLRYRSEMAGMLTYAHVC